MHAAGALHVPRYGCGRRRPSSAREAWNSLILSGSALVLLSPASLPLPSSSMWKREFTGRMTLTRSWVGVGCLDLRASHVHHQLRRPVKLSLDNLSRWCYGGLLDLLTLRSAKVRAGTVGLAPSSRSYLMVGRAASIHAVFAMM